MSEFVRTGRDAYGQPVYEEVLNQEEIIERLKSTVEWREFSDRFDTSSDSNNKLLGMLFVEKLGADPGVEDYQRLLKNIIRSGGVVRLSTIKDSSGNILLEAGQYEFDLRPSPEPIVEEPAPVHRGQQLWSEYRQFSESHSTQDCRNRAKIDAGFASFRRNNYEREARETASTQFQLAGQRSADNKPTVTPELISFAEEFRRTPMDRVRVLKSPGLNPLGWEGYVKNMDAAFAAGLL